MLTSLHYYNHYKPFIIKEKSGISFYDTKVQKKKNTLYYMNKSLNNNMISYIEGFSKYFNNLKNIANSILEKPKYTLDTNKNALIANFTSSFNELSYFLADNLNNSSKFKNIDDTIKDTVQNNKDFLKKLNINVSESSKLFFDKEKIIPFSLSETDVKTFYNSIYDSLCNFMSEPLATHMDFRDFSYYYNYSHGQTKKQSFKVIEQGVLIDISL